MEQMDADSKTRRGGKDDEDGIKMLWAKKGFVSTLEAPPDSSLPQYRWKRVLESTGPCPGSPYPTLAIVGFINVSNHAEGWVGQVHT